MLAEAKIHLTSNFLQGLDIPEAFLNITHAPGEQLPDNNFPEDGTQITDIQ
jgi:hypothetical protein